MGKVLKSKTARSNWLKPEAEEAGSDSSEQEANAN